MTITIAMSSGRGTASGRWIAWDDEAAYSITGLTLTAGHVYRIILSDLRAVLPMADASTATAESSTLTGTVNLSNTSIGAVIANRRQEPIEALLSVYDVTSGQMLGTCVVTIDRAPQPDGLDPVTVVTVGMTAAEVAALITVHAALTTGVHGVGAGTVAKTADIPAGSDVAPQALGVAAAGVATAWSRGDHVHVMPSAANVGAVAGASGTALPTGGSIVTGQIFRLTAADAAAYAPPGWYVHDGTGWLCLGCLAAYAFGNTGATPSFTLIGGAAYTWAFDQIVSSWALAMSRPGIPAIWRAADAGGTSVATPTAAGRIVKTVNFTGITSALTTGTIWDDGTYLWVAVGEAD